VQSSRLLWISVDSLRLSLPSFNVGFIQMQVQSQLQLIQFQNAAGPQ
jgi:hypothetical protein